MLGKGGRYVYFLKLKVIKMIRYLMVKKEKLLSGGLRESFYTILGDSHELELALCAGGSGEDQYEIHSLVGVEVVGE